MIVEDDNDVMEMLRSHLEKAGGFLTSSASDGATALRLARDEIPDVIILDLMLPKMSGLEICRSLKATPATANIAILMLTAKAEEIDRIVGLELGADDYVTKPFSPREVVLRTRAIARRGSSEVADEKVNIGSITRGHFPARSHGRAQTRAPNLGRVQVARDAHSTARAGPVARSIAQ